MVESWSTAWNPAAALDRCYLLLSLVWRDARLRPVVDVQLSSAPEHKTTPSLVVRSLPRMISMYCTTCTLRTLAHSVRVRRARAPREVARGILVDRLARLVLMLWSTIHPGRRGRHLDSSSTVLGPLRSAPLRPSARFMLEFAWGLGQTTRPTDDTVRGIRGTVLYHIQYMSAAA